MKDVARHALQDRFDLFESCRVVGADDEGGLAGVGCVHVGLGDGAVDECEGVLGEFFAEGDGVEGGGGGGVYYDCACIISSAGL